MSNQTTRVSEILNKHGFWIIQALASILLLYNISSFLPGKILMLLLFFLIFIFLPLLYLQLSSHAKPFQFWGSRVLSFLLSILLLLVDFGMINIMKITIDQVANNQIESSSVSVLVKTGNANKTIEALNGKRFGILKNIDREHTDFMLNVLLYMYKKELTPVEYNSGDDMLRDLQKGAIDAMILNDGIYKEYASVNTRFKSETANIYTVNQQKLVENKNKTDVTNSSFTVFISGLDVKGDIATTGRSDLNMLAVGKRQIQYIYKRTATHDIIYPQEAVLYSYYIG